MRVYVSVHTFKETQSSSKKEDSFFLFVNYKIYTIPSHAEMELTSRHTVREHDGV